MSINNYELLNKQARPFIVFWNMGCTQSLLVNFKYWIVPLISSRVSGYSHVILLSSVLTLTPHVLLLLQCFAEKKSMHSKLAIAAIWHHIYCCLILFSWARLTKTYDVTIQRYRNLQAKIEDSKIHILRCMGSKFCVKFQRFPLKFHTKFWTHTTQNMHFTRC